MRHKPPIRWSAISSTSPGAPRRSVTPYSQAKIDAAKWVNAHGGVNGKQINLQTFDYSYEVPRAIATYKQWKQDGMVALQGWGTADTEALVGFVADDQIPYFSASYSAHLTDPTGKGKETKKPTPYNFIMGPSYSDSIRAMLQWAKADWEKKRRPGRAEVRAHGRQPSLPERTEEGRRRICQGNRLRRAAGDPVLAGAG